MSKREVPSNLAFQKNSIQNTWKDWLWSFLVAWVLPDTIRPASLMKKSITIPAHISSLQANIIHFSQVKFHVNFLFTLVCVLASNYPNVNPKCELQAWWSNEWFLFQHNTAKLLKCELLLMLIAKLQQRNPKILALISTLCLCICPLCLCLSHIAQAFHHKPCDRVAIFLVSSFIKESMQIHALPWLVYLQKEWK